MGHLAKYVLMRYYIYFVLYAQLFYLNISSSVTTYHSTPSCLHTQTAAASQPRHHYQHDEQEQLVQGRDIHPRDRHCWAVDELFPYNGCHDQPHSKTAKINDAFTVVWPKLFFSFFFFYLHSLIF